MKTTNPLKMPAIILACITLGFASIPAQAGQPMASLATFHDLAELKEFTEPTVALQLGSAGGLWIRQDGQAADNGGTIVDVGASHHWMRQCDPGRLDARWFGVVADGETDDAPALQAAIDALPPSGGKVLLPSGRMLCRQSLEIRRSYVTLEGVNSGLLSKHFEPGKSIGQGSLLLFDSCDGIIIQPPDKVKGEPKPDRLGGITLREFGIAGTGKQDGQTGVIVKCSNRGWGTTDGLYLTRMYFIDLTWAAEFNQADMSVIDGSWLSECGNGLRLNGCLYNIISNTCFADNDDIGIEIQGGRGMHINSPVFVRNKRHLIIHNSHRNRIIGGVFESDNAGGERDDQDFIRMTRSRETLIQGSAFTNSSSTKPAAIHYQGPAPTLVGCTYSGNVEQLSAEY